MKVVLLLVVLAAIGGFLYLNRNTLATSPVGAPVTGTSPIPTSEPSANAATTVSFTANGFVPQTIMVSPGTRVTWTNQSGSAATVNSDDHPTHLKFPFLNLGKLDPGSTLSVVLPTTPGTYTYHDHFHPQFKGTVIVK